MFDRVILQIFQTKELGNFMARIPCIYEVNEIDELSLEHLVVSEE